MLAAQKPAAAAAARAARPVAAAATPGSRTPLLAARPGRRPVLLARAGGSEGGAETAELTGIVFQPFQEVAGALTSLDALLAEGSPDALPGPSRGLSGVSLGRMDYEARLEAAINEQINVELNVSYVYTALAAFMDRDNIGLLGFAAYFAKQSDEERHHARLLMRQQNRRGGRVKLATVLAPETEFAHAERGEALWGLELSLALEKLNFRKLRDLHAVATEAGDAEMTHFLEDYLLHEQAVDVEAAAQLVSRLRRAGHGHGTFHLDLELQRQYGCGLAQEGGGGGDGGGGGGDGGGGGNGVALG